LRTYELITVFHPEATDDARREVQDKVRAAVEKFGGEIQGVDDWGKRKLAYPVRKHRYGQMVRVQMQAEPRVVHDLDQVLRHAEPVIRYMASVLTEKMLKQKAAPEAQAPAALDTAENGRRRR
jgi:small subunit ribosomal protein S6